MTQQDLLAMFELEPTASWEQVRSSYRRLIRTWHPDKFRMNDKLRVRAECFTRQLNSAFDELERIYVNGAWGFSAASTLESEQKPEPTPAPPTKAKRKHDFSETGKRRTIFSKRSLTQWEMNVFGLPIDFQVLITSLGIALILLIPVLVILQGSNLSLTTQLITPFTATFTALSHWGHNFAIGITSGIVAFFVTL